MLDLEPELMWLLLFSEFKYLPQRLWRFRHYRKKHFITVTIFRCIHLFIFFFMEPRVSNLLKRLLIYWFFCLLWIILHSTRIFCLTQGSLGHVGKVMFHVPGHSSFFHDEWVQHNTLSGQLINHLREEVVLGHSAETWVACTQTYCPSSKHKND